MIRPIAAACLFAIALVGCKNDEQCERMRMGLAKTYGSLRESASKRKLAGVDVEGWAAVEEKAALLESSFMTSQVTWASADRARTELNQKFSGRQTDSEANLQGYRLSLDAALKQHDEFAQKCR